MSNPDIYGELLAASSASTLQPQPPPLPSRSPKPQYMRMSSAITIPNARSPASTSSYYSFNGSTSLQSTPEGIVPVSHSSLPQPTSFYLPEPLLLPPTSTPPTSSTSAMAEAWAKSSGGLIRRVSRGARQGIQDKFRRGGTSAHRDKSSGPVIMRRRSDSRSALDNAAVDVSDLDLGGDVEEEEAVEDFVEPLNALGISANRPPVTSIPESSDDAPVRKQRLEQGTRFIKVAKKKTKAITLRLDLDHGIVYWDPQRPSKYFSIDDVKEIRSGPETRHYREEFKYSEHYEPLWFTIVYSDTARAKGKTKQMHLIASDPGTIKLWTQTLDKVSRERIEIMAGLLSSAEKSAKLVWQREMTKRFQGSEHRPDEETMDFQGIIKLCRSLHINCSEDMYRSYFNKADVESTGKLNQQQFLSFVRQLKERRDIRPIYERFVSKDETEMTRKAFFTFLAKEQGVFVSQEADYWTSIFEKCARASKPKTVPSEELTMDLAGFQTFLTSSANSCYAPSTAQVQLSRPLNEYFISSSHNTYLTGRQVIGESSTEPYITALQKGCRCLEIDCWNGNDKQPIVNHGRTLTTSISFKDTIKVINQYAFCESSYPLILSLEVHCDREQQARMAEIMIEEFGDKLVLEPLDFHSSNLPSPEELKGKILVKVKAAADEADSSSSNKPSATDLPVRTRQRSLSSPWSRPMQLDNSTIPPLSSPPSLSPPERTSSFWTSPRTSTTSTNATLPTPPLISSADDTDSPPATDVEKKKKNSSTTSKIIPVLGDLGVYTKGYKFTSFKTPEAHSFNHVFSIGERTFRKLIEQDPQTRRALEEHNVRSLMRVYPSFHRVTSTNFEPLSHWRRGVQMVALNWQTYDLGQQLNEAMFAGGNDGTGYVLKPAEMRLLEPPEANGGHRLAPKQLVQFSVQIISAQQLPRPKSLSADANINPYIEFEVHWAEDMDRHATAESSQDASARSGLPGIGDPLRTRTRIIKGNGYNPEFKDKISVSIITRYPSLVFIRWSVWNSRDAQTTERAPLATFTAKLDNLRQGYRHLPLFDSAGEQYLFSTLFCKFSKMEAIEVPEEWGATHTPRCVVEHKSVFSPCEAGGNPQLQNNGRSLLRKLIHRTPSGGKRQRKDVMFHRMYSDSRDGGLEVSHQ